MRRKIGLRLQGALLVIGGLSPTLGLTAYLLARLGSGALEVIAVPAALFLVGLGLAWAIGSRAAAAVGSLGDAATALGRGDPLPPVKAVVREIAEVADALDATAARLAARSAEHAASEKRLEDFARAGSDWFWEMAPDLVSLNVVACGSARFSAEEIARRSFNWAEDTGDEAQREFLRARLRERRAFRDITLQFPDVGRTRYIKISGVPCFDRNEVFLGYRGTGSDVTAEHEQAAQVHLAERQLQYSQKLEALGTLAGGVAHDLNNLLVPILALTKLTAARLPEGSPQRRNLERVMEASQRAKDLVRQILAFSRKEEAVKREVDLTPILREALPMLRPAIPAAIRFVEQVEPVPTIYGDPGQLHQVIVNLVTNAAHAIGNGNGTIALALKPAAWGEGRSGIVLEVADDGCGMEEAVRVRIFDPFFTTRPVGEGTGLGLSVVHGIVTAHGGTIEVTSRAGAGSCFRVRLPAFTPALPPAPPTDTAASASGELMMSPR